MKALVEPSLDSLYLCFHCLFQHTYGFEEIVTAI